MLSEETFELDSDLVGQRAPKRRVLSWCHSAQDHHSAPGQRLLDGNNTMPGTALWSLATSRGFDCYDARTFVPYRHIFFGHVRSHTMQQSCCYAAKLGALASCNTPCFMHISVCFQPATLRPLSRGIEYREWDENISYSTSWFQPEFLVRGRTRFQTNPWAPS